MEPHTLMFALAALVNLAGLIWGASQLHAAVKTLEKVSRKLEKSDERQWQSIASQETRLAVLESRLQGSGG